MQTASCYDQLNISRLACMELVCRTIQVVQMRYRERFLPTAKGKGARASSVEDDAYLYMGTSQKCGRICICPELTAHNAEKQHTEAQIYKLRRKLAEERRLLKKV